MSEAELKKDKEDEPEAKEPPKAVVVKYSPRSVQELLILIAAIGVVVVNVVTVYTSAQTMGKVEAAKEQAARSATEADEKLDVIHEQTNSNLTGVNDRLEKAYTKIEALEKLLSVEKVPEKPTEENQP